MEIESRNDAAPAFQHIEPDSAEYLYFQSLIDEAEEREKEWERKNVFQKIWWALFEFDKH